jgi:tetratricopeptide (TPR) repeat protein
MVRRLLLAAALLLSSISCREVRPQARHSLDAPPPLQDTFVFQDKPLPTKAEWLKQLIQHPDEEPNLVEAITVVACDRLGIRRPYSTIQRSLAPYVQSVGKRLKPSSTADNKIDALNEVVLPAIQQGLRGEFAWLMEALQAPSPADSGGETGTCFVSSTLYMIAAEMLSLRLEMFPLPHHVALCHVSTDRRRNIECTDKGQHLTLDQYRERWLKSDPDYTESIPEEKPAAEKFCAPFTRRQLAVVLMRQGVTFTNPAAEETLKDATLIVPDFYVPWKLLSGYYTQKDRYSEAEAAMTKSIELAPHLPMLYAARAMGRVLLKKEAGALEDIDAALSKSPRYPKYHQCKGLILIRMERYHEASASLLQAAEGAPHAPEFWRFLGLCYKKLKDYQKSADALTRAIQINPRNADYYDRRAEMWAMLGDEQRWEADRRKAKELGGVRD